jgi:hypothetical protein
MRVVVFHPRVVKMGDVVGGIPAKRSEKYKSRSA